MPADTAVELDEPGNWPAVERLLLSRCPQPPRQATVKVLVCDVDGTMTDGGMYYDESGEAFKKFNTKDAHGLQLRRDRGVEVWVMTGEQSAVTKARLAKLGITGAYCGVSKKVETCASSAGRRTSRWTTSPTWAMTSMTSTVFAPYGCRHARQTPVRR